ncbi:MAG: hypothetical protein ACXWP6_06925 [Ktedonobacterales bacterium]
MDRWSFRTLLIETPIRRTTGPPDQPQDPRYAVSVAFQAAHMSDVR